MTRDINCIYQAINIVQIYVLDFWFYKMRKQLSKIVI